MRTIPNTRHAVPVDQPHSVHQIAERLFPAYTVEGGSVQLAGCLLEDRLFVCTTPPVGKAPAIFLDAEGRRVHPAVVEQLGLDCLEPVNRPPRRCDDEIARLAEAAERLSAEDGSGEITSLTAIWVKYADGTLRFRLGDQSLDLPFSGWARTLEPPSLRCPATGQPTFHLAKTDDGVIASARAIAICEESGQRVLASELVLCAATGRRVLSSLSAACPVTGERVLARALVPCGVCRQLVAPAALDVGQCCACRDLAAVSKNDPRMVRLLDEHPKWQRWAHWRLAETPHVFVLTAARWLDRILLVVDRPTLELVGMSLGHRVFGRWREVSRDQWPVVLSD